MNIMLNFDETDIGLALQTIVVHENKDEIIKLLTPVICASNTLSQLFLQSLFGKKLFDVIPNGTICKIEKSNIGYISDNITLILDSENKVTVTVDSFLSYHDYTQYRILSNGKDETYGNLVKFNTYCAHKDLEILEDF